MPKANYLIPGATIRCAGKPVATFEVLSSGDTDGPAHRLAFDRKREKYKDTDGMREIVELRQDAFVCHVRRRFDDERWVIEDLIGPRAVLRLERLGIEMRHADLYFAVLDPSADFEEEEILADEA